MEVQLLRFNGEADYTDGLFIVDGKHICFSIEDEVRSVKKWGETCIPEGRFPIKLRKEGRFHERYKNKFPDIHKGMLCITNEDDWVLSANGLSFKYILIHIGNDDDDTAGCLLTGMTSHADKNLIERSTVAYKKLYPIIANHLANGGEAWITVKSIAK